MDRQKLGTFVLGGVAGAVAGILAAPRSGRETRGSILNRAGEARERGRESYFEARERARERRSGRRGPAGDEPPGMTLGETPGGDAPSDEPAPGDARREGGFPLRAVPPEEGAASPEELEELRRRIESTRRRLHGRSQGEKGENGRG